MLEDRATAQGFVDACEQPPVSRDADLISGGGPEPFHYRFALNRAITALGLDQAPDDIVPESPDPLLAGLVRYERAVVVLAQLHGRAWRGDALNAATFVDAARPLLHLFNRDSRSPDHWLGWYRAEGSRAVLYRRLVGPFR